MEEGAGKEAWVWGTPAQAQAAAEGSPPVQGPPAGEHAEEGSPGGWGVRPQRRARYRGPYTEPDDEDLVDSGAEMKQQQEEQEEEGEERPSRRRRPAHSGAGGASSSRRSSAGRQRAPAKRRSAGSEDSDAPGAKQQARSCTAFNSLLSFAGLPCEAIRSASC